jgi:hypothetical protein
LIGSEVAFPCHRAKVSTCIVDPPEVCDPDPISLDASYPVRRKSLQQTTDATLTTMAKELA